MLKVLASCELIEANVYEGGVRGKVYSEKRKVSAVDALAAVRELKDRKIALEYGWSDLDSVIERFTKLALASEKLKKFCPNADLPLMFSGSVCSRGFYLCFEILGVILRKDSETLKIDEWAEYAEASGLMIDGEELPSLVLI